MRSLISRFLPVAFVLVAGLFSSLRAADPVLRFPDGLSWKDVFDSGFRPKHLAGLSHTTCVCMDQRFTLEMSQTGKTFFLDTGRLSFRLQSDDTIGVFWHSGWVPISLEEGQRKLQEFRDWIGKENLRNKGRVPPVIDPRSGLVNADSEYHATAKVGRYVLAYGFAASFRKEAPLIPHLHIAWTREKGQNLPPVRMKVVEPPAGYEWYSLDPKIDTPEPGVRRPAKDQPRSAGEVMAAEDSTARKARMEAEKQRMVEWAKGLWPLLLAFLAAAVAGILWKRRQARG